MVNAFAHLDAHEGEMLRGITKSPANEHLVSHMRKLQPHSDTNDTYCAATLNPAFAHRAWFLTPCNTRYKARLVCQADKADNPPTHISYVYCMGQTYVFSK